MIHELATFVADMTVRGECQCGRCFDKGDRPDPVGPHVVDLMFFKVGLSQTSTPIEAARERFIELTKANLKGEFGDVDVLDRNEHSYIELGGWIGDQGLAMQYMGLGTILGVFQLLTPRTILGNTIPETLAMQMAGNGMISVIAKSQTPAPVPV